MKKKLIGILVVIGVVIISMVVMKEVLSNQDTGKQPIVPGPDDKQPSEAKPEKESKGNAGDMTVPDTNLDPVDQQDTTHEEFSAFEITDDIFERMYGKSYKADCTIPREELRYLKVSHYGFDGEVHQGELVVNASIADEVLDIFRELYEIQYPIEKLCLIDDYEADDERSMADNNSSAFNYRMISGTNKLSNHSKGLAIDINPLYNPYVHNNAGTKACEPANAAAYTDRSLEFDYKIDETDECCRIFTEHGFTWGGSWTRSKDYQHFEKAN